MTRGWMLVFLVLILASALAPPVRAQEGLDVTTAYPAVTVDPGATATFPLTIETAVPERVDLSVTSVPDGWEATLRGGGSTIEAVYTSSGDEPPEATVQVEVPEDAAADAYQVLVEARTATVSHQLTLDLRVAEVEVGAVAMTAQFPSLRGPADAAFRFDVELENGTNQEVTFTLETQAPPGWTVDARPTGEEQAATTIVEAGGTARIEVTADPPDTAAAQQYPILVRAVGGPQPAQSELMIEITGSRAMALATGDGRLNARVTVGGTAPVALRVTNEGTAPLANVSLSGTPPQGWEIEFTPPTIAELPAGASQDVTATLTAAGDAIAGDYAVSVRATSEDTTDSIELRTTVEASPVGGFIGLGLLALVALGLFLVFRRYGRR